MTDDNGRDEALREAMDDEDLEPGAVILACVGKPWCDYDGSGDPFAVLEECPYCERRIMQEDGSWIIERPTTQ